MNNQPNQDTKSYLLNLLSAAVNDFSPTPPPKDLNWEKLYHLAKAHSVANTAYYGLLKLETENRPSEQQLAPFRLAAEKNIAKEAVQHFEGEAVLRKLEERQIKCMPLKGSVIKYLYPRPDMRSMADLDILFDDDRTDEVEAILNGLGYSTELMRVCTHDVYYKSPYMNIEMHRALLDEKRDTTGYFKNVWERAKLQEGHRFLHEMTAEDFYLFLLVHLSKHYSCHGTGIRSILDVWIYLKHYRECLNWDYVRNQLSQMKLLDFSIEVQNLALAWFGNSSVEEQNRDMGLYILNGGTYGMISNHLTETLIGTGKESDGLNTKKAKYFLRRCFPEVKNMRPIVQRHPFLQPLFWMIRFIEFPFRDKKFFHYEWNYLKNLDMEKVNLYENARQSTPKK